MLYTAEQAELAKSIWQKTSEIANTQGHVGLYRKAQLMALRTARSIEQVDTNEKRLYDALAWRLNQWSAEQVETWEENMAEAWRQFGIRQPKYVKARDEFFANPKTPKIWPANKHNGENGVRIKVPEFVPVPQDLKRKPN